MEIVNIINAATWLMVVFFTGWIIYRIVAIWFSDSNKKLRDIGLNIVILISLSFVIKWYPAFILESINESLIHSEPQLEQLHKTLGDWIDKPLNGDYEIGPSYPGPGVQDTPTPAIVDIIPTREPTSPPPPATSTPTPEIKSETPISGVSDPIISDCKITWSSGQTKLNAAVIAGITIAKLESLNPNSKFEPGDTIYVCE